MLLNRFLPDDDPRAWRRAFLALLVAVTALRTWLAATLPFTGDEAYFYFWGRNPDWGYYDHPPMVGWWLAALLSVSDHPGWLRLPALAVPPAIALATRAVLAPAGPVVAWGGATLVLLAPLNSVNVAITTDIPLMAFAAAAAALYLRALRTGRSADYLLAGLMLAGAVLSKYFAGPLALAIGGHRLVSRAPGRWRGFALLVAGSLPAVAVMVPWNAANCWPNLMFNLVNRHGDAGCPGARRCSTRRRSPTCSACRCCGPAASRPCPAGVRRRRGARLDDGAAVRAVRRAVGGEDGRAALARRVRRAGHLVVRVAGRRGRGPAAATARCASRWRSRSGWACCTGSRSACSRPRRPSASRAGSRTRAWS
jgi:hypothetical protein